MSNDMSAALAGIAAATEAAESERHMPRVVATLDSPAGTVSIVEPCHGVVGLDDDTAR